MLGVLETRQRVAAQCSNGRLSLYFSFVEVTRWTSSHRRGLILNKAAEPPEPFLGRLRGRESPSQAAFRAPKATGSHGKPSSGSRPAWDSNQNCNSSPLLPRSRVVCSESANRTARRSADTIPNNSGEADEIKKWTPIECPCQFHDCSSRMRRSREQRGESKALFFKSRVKHGNRARSRWRGAVPKTHYA
jgi:hypothetical protein